MCTGLETDVTDCLVEEECTGEDYASVVCYGFSLTTPGRLHVGNCKYFE
jgi:hypothetical protein